MSSGSKRTSISLTGAFSWFTRRALEPLTLSWMGWGPAPDSCSYWRSTTLVRANQMKLSSSTRARIGQRTHGMATPVMVWNELARVTLAYQ